MDKSMSLIDCTTLSPPKERSTFAAVDLFKLRYTHVSIMFPAWDYSAINGVIHYR